jgi:hypothetical protein
LLLEKNLFDDKSDMVSDLCLEKYGDAFAGNKISVLLEFCVLKHLESSRNIYVYKN